jgi:hypothetical protein
MIFGYDIEVKLSDNKYSFILYCNDKNKGRVHCDHSSNRGMFYYTSPETYKDDIREAIREHEEKCHTK